MQIGVGTFRASPLAKKFVNQVLDSGRLSYGPFSRKFEQEFGAIHGVKHSIFTNSGTSALHIALQALKEEYGWKDGDEVLVPATTFVATANVVLHNKLVPVFVDIDPMTFNIDPSEIRASISDRTRCIIPVHLLGLPADMPEIMRKAIRYNLKVIEDSCETMFAKSDDRYVGSFGDISCFSTYVAHYIVTGIGGIACTNNDKLAIRLRSLMNHGRDSIYLNIDDDRHNGSKLHEIANKRFRFVSAGHSFRATEMEAALGLAQLKDYKETVKKRQWVAQSLINGLESLKDRLQLPYVPTGTDHVFMLFPIVLKQGNRRKLINYLEDAGIETRDLLPLINQPIYESLYKKGSCPVSEWLIKQAFYIGCHQDMGQKEIDYVVKTFKRFLMTRNEND